MIIYMYVHSEVEQFPVTHNKSNSTDRTIEATRSPMLLPERVIYKQTIK